MHSMSCECLVVLVTEVYAISGIIGLSDSAYDVNDSCREGILKVCAETHCHRYLLGEPQK